MTKEQQDELYHFHGQNIAINDLSEEEAGKLIEKLDREMMSNPVSDARRRRIRRLFLKKLAANDPNHPWCKSKRRYLLPPINDKSCEAINTLTPTRLNSAKRLNT